MVIKVKNLGASPRGICKKLIFDFEASLGAFKSRLSSTIKMNDYSQEKDAVIISFDKSFNGLDEIHELGTKLYNIPSYIGRYDGHEVAIDDSHGTLFAYGNNAEKLFKEMEPILKEYEFLREASVYLRFEKKDYTYSELDFRIV